MYVMESNKILQSDYLDLLYNNRNKRYGSYQLRKNYKSSATKALVITLSAIVIGFGTPVLLQKSHAESNNLIADNSSAREVITEIHDIKLPKPEIPKPIEQTTEGKSAPPKRAKTIQNTVPKIVANNAVKPSIKPPDLSDLDNAVAGPVTFEGEGGNSIATTKKPHSGPFGNGIDSTGDAETVKPPVIDEPVNFSEIPPEFPGGLNALHAYLSKNVKYPRQAAEDGIQGKVVIKFVVNGKGEIEQAKVMRGIGAGCDKEALRVVNGMPKWNPGKQNGHAVKVYYTLPVDFRLN